MALLLLMCGYFGFGYHEISSVMEPATLVAVAEGWIKDKIPEARQAVEAEVQRSSPVWAASLSKQAQSQLPAVRTRLEEYVLTQVDQMVDQTVVVTEQQFREFLREHRDALEQGFKDLATSPELADESLDRLQAAVEDQFQFKMNEGADDLFAALNQLSSRLTHLKENNELTDEEALERQILMQARRLQLQQAELQP
ncbi:MAG: hypothetical protein EXS05_18245 [Planctomycetaceae bacterium]|nr:hypothetical protein [Planctomycetaceae bacterium]